MSMSFNFETLYKVNWQKDTLCDRNILNLEFPVNGKIFTLKTLTENL